MKHTGLTGKYHAERILNAKFLEKGKNNHTSMHGSLKLACVSPYYTSSRPVMNYLFHFYKGLLLIDK